MGSNSERLLTPVERYNEYSKKFNTVYEYLRRNSRNREQVVNEICEKRGYEVERMAGELLRAGFIYLKEDTDLEKIKKPAFNDLALFNQDGEFRLEGRYIFPVKDMVGNVVALIGWKEGNYKSKYLTTPSKYFSKATLFYGMEQLSSVGLNKNFFLVEGIFDSLSLRSLGFNALANMGAEFNRNKVVLYSLTKRIIGIPDVDQTGRKILKQNMWSIPVNGSYLNWRGFGDKVKDIDDLVQMIEEDDLKEILSEVWSEKDRIITLEA